MDVPIGVLEWELFLPQQFKVKDFSGDAFSAALLPAEFAAGVGAGNGAGLAPGYGGGTGGGAFALGSASVPRAWCHRRLLAPVARSQRANSLVTLSTKRAPLSLTPVSTCRICRQVAAGPPPLLPTGSGFSAACLLALTR